MKRKKWKLSTVLLLLIGIALIIAALILLIPPLLDRKQANDTYADLEQSNVVITVMEEQEDIIEQESSMQETEPEDDRWWYEEVSVDMEALQKMNEDITGWIRFDNLETISYPVLYSGDDETYLKTDIYGNHSSAGCIFIEGANDPDLSDAHTIIYGHNMKNGSMFGNLKEYKKEGFYEGNQYFTIYTKDAVYRYQIFSYRDVPDYHSVYTVGFLPDETFKEFVDEMILHSYKQTGIEVSKDDKVITLSTCSETGKRFVVHAVRIEEYVY